MSWENRNFRELGFLGRGKSRHRPRNDESLYGGDYPMIQTGDVKAANFYLNSFSQTYNEKGLAQSKLWEPNTLCITIAANIAETAILGMKACFPDSIIGFIADEEKSDVRFIKYFFDIYKERMQRISQGATQDNLSLEKLLTFEVPTPPLQTQKRIADILSAYDDLIENNQKRIKLLEQAVQNIYKEWFVNLRFPGYENAVANEETGLPEGWTERNINEVFNIKYGKNLPATKITSSGKYSVYGASGVMGYYEECNTEIKVALITSRGNGSGDVHRTFQKNSFVTNNSFKVFPKEGYEFYPFFFVTEFLKTLNLLNYCSGSAQPQLTNASMNNIRSIFPNKEMVALFTQKVSPILEQSDVLLKQNQKLKAARDILLPRLMNRTIEV